MNPLSAPFRRPAQVVCLYISPVNPADGGTGDLGDIAELCLALKTQTTDKADKRPTNVRAGEYVPCRAPESLEGKEL